MILGILFAAVVDGVLMSGQVVAAAEELHAWAQPSFFL